MTRQAQVLFIRQWEPDVTLTLENLERFEAADFNPLVEDIQSLRRKRHGAMMRVLQVEKQIVVLDAQQPEFGRDLVDTEERQDMEVARHKAKIAQLQERAKMLQGEYDSVDVQYKLVKHRLAEMEADE